MDESKSKAMNWTDNIYNTIEGIVPDVDDIQDTFKYVENRVTSVGGSLKKFYSGVVLDFFPLSADPTTEAEAAEPEPNSASSADPTTEAEATEPEPNSASSADQSAEPEEAKAVKTPEEEEEEESGVSVDNNTTTEREEEEEVNIESAFYSLMINVSETSSTDEKSIASEDDCSVISTSVECSSSGFGSPVFFTVPGSETSTLFDSDVSSLCLSPFDLSRLASDSTNETNNEVVVETRDLLLESNDDSGVERMEVISLQNGDDEEETAKLEDSCVIVDDMVLYAVSRRAQRLGSYKNKLRDIFASKKRLAKEYEQLAIWYGDANIEPTPSSQNSQASHSCDSDWEIL